MPNAGIPQDLAQHGDPPAREGELQVRRPPGVRAGPYPDIQIIVTASTEHLAAARLHTAGPPPRHPGATDPLDLGLNLTATPMSTSVAPSGTGMGGASRNGPAALGLGSGFGFAHAQHTGPIHPSVLAMLACTGKIRRILLDEHGAVLHLGRSHRLATPAQKAALLARDVGCVIPGCTTPGDLCDIHHVTPWTNHGDTDIHNLRSYAPGTTARSPTAPGRSRCSTACPGPDHPPGPTPPDPSSATPATTDDDQPGMTRNAGDPAVRGS